MAYGTYTWLDLIPMEQGHRLESRIPKALAVRIQGTHRDGYTFIQDAGTIDISKRGAQLAWETCLNGPGEIIQVQHNRQQAHFRVVWVGQAGTPHANRVGICCLEADQCIWSAHIDQGKTDNQRIASE